MQAYIVTGVREAHSLAAKMRRQGFFVAVRARDNGTVYVVGDNKPWAILDAHVTRSTQVREATMDELPRSLRSRLPATLFLT